MGKYILFFIAGLYFYSFFIVCWHKLLDKKVDFKNYKFYLALVILVTFGMIINYNITPFLKLFCVVFLFFIVNYIFFCKNISKSLIAVLFSEVIIVISELIFTFGLALFMGNELDNFAPTTIGTLVINVGVASVALILIRFKFIYKFYNYLISTFNNMKKSNLIVYFILTIALIAIFAIIVHMDLPLTFLLICVAVLTVFYIVMLFRLANARENYRTVTSKYETSISSLREYEGMMDRYRVANHETKNQFLTIRNMVNPKDKKTINYIDKLIDNKIKDNEKIFNQTSKIPEGGLRAIIYSKLCKMKDMKIEYDIDIANDIKTVDIIEIGDYTILNTCKILGVFFDNAIEAVEQLPEKKITVEIYIIDNSLYIEISNNYQGQIKVDKINNKGYTTKGNDHGYGLTLVNNLVKEDSNLTHETEISKDEFTQRLKIKM